MVKQQRAQEAEELHYAEKETRDEDREEIAKDEERVLNKEKKECHDESGDKLEEHEETKKEERSKEIVDGKEQGKEEIKKKDKKKKKKKKNKPKTAEEEEDMYKDIGQLKQKLEKIDGKIEALLEKKAFFSRKLKEAEAGNSETSEKPTLKEVAAADGAIVPPP
ncbi:ABC transporter F family member 4-like [Rhodamnia argentea]|uniref:ABC transporter F family member 4-like n=1 Tax=Rhodamnia argentea TaxID=178133 RepID=A0A8B8NTS4_9MYRT|nr:ABC transporter F family member 4-like [Rhodamnia argentea]XP_030525927.2 ABC transporter F family member 4-like [Rhodamnia argentea]XP_048138497.1 ABC transporter F family member 4-like [Rhodamnia argentea]